MNAQEMLLSYANSNGATNPQQFIGQAIKEGIVINRGPDIMTVANVRREGKEIIVTETTKNNLHNTSETVEIFRVTV